MEPYRQDTIPMLIVPYIKILSTGLNGLKVNIIGEDNITIVNVKDFFPQVSMN
jgi:hypothetical protein